MRIDSSFAEADIGKIKPGQKVRFTVDAFPERNPSTGEVQQIRLNPTVTQNVVTYNVRISLQNPDQILLPGMTAYVNIAIAKRDDVLMVPNAALRFKPGLRRKDGEKKGGRVKHDGQRHRPPRGTQRQGRGNHDGNSGTVYVVEGDVIRPVSVEIGITDNRNDRDRRRRTEGRRHRSSAKSADRRPEQAEQRRHEAVLVGEAVIRVAGLGKSYVTEAGLFPALKGVDLTIERGEFVAIMGPRVPANRPS
jgi:multidrug efflux pump subunit AcrA (membrane-fusion protein)